MKLKNDENHHWTLVFSQMIHDNRHKLGSETVAADEFSRVCASFSQTSL